MPVIDVGYDPSVNPSAEGARGTYTPIPEGIYHLKALSAVMKPPKEAGKFPQIEVEMEIIHSETGKKLGAKFRNWFSCSPNATPYFLKPYLDAIGVQYETVNVAGPGGNIAAYRFDTDHIVGAVVKAKCTHGEKQGGGVRENWGSFEPSEYDPANVKAPTPAAPAPQAAAPAAAMPPRAPRRVG